jgi:acyl-coenzyme A synthetase/AMP-(fatty) acid ligase
VFVYNYARFNAKAALEAMCRCSVATLCAPPTVWRMLIQEDLKSYPVKLKGLVGAGEPLNPEVIEQVQKAWNVTIRDGLGQTETSVMIANTPGQTVKVGSMGRPLPGFKVALLDSDDKPAEEGEISVALEAVAEAAIVPSPDPVRLAVPKAFVTLRAGHAPSRELARDVLRYCRENLAPYKRIRRLEFAELPKTVSGKIRRVDLRKRELARSDLTQRADMEFWEEDFSDLK